jgi:hypothetical protein
VLDRTFILYTEPDKETFFHRHLHDFVRQAPSESGIGIVLAARSTRSFDTFPPMQRYVESVVNHLCSEMLGVHGDYTYGPFLMHRLLASRALDANLQLGWGWRPFVIRGASEHRLRIVHVSGDYPCPDEQDGEDESERRHRLRQLRDNVAGLIA